jgi:predicted DNA-binding protein (MmcQ/YjbR family)
MLFYGKEAAMARDPFHDRLLAITLRLPGTFEDRPWGSVHCKVDGKIFVGWGRLDDGEMSVGLRVDKAIQLMLITQDPRFTIAKYVGKHGGVDMRLGPYPDWLEVERFIVGSYRLIAKKTRLAELDAMRKPTATSEPRAKSQKKTTVKTQPPAKPKRKTTRSPAPLRRLS